MTASRIAARRRRARDGRLGARRLRRRDRAGVLRRRQLYRTVNTPTDLSHTGAPAHSFDTIYALAGQPFNVATAAPGDRDYNGGRWMVHEIAYNTSWAATVAAHDANDSGDLDSEAEVLAALADAGPGGATDAGVVKQFVCPVIKLK